MTQLTNPSLGVKKQILSLSVDSFADDTSLGYSSQNVVEIENVINHDLCELNTCSTKWLMSFNPDKIEIILFSNTDVRYNYNFSFNGNNIHITMSHKRIKTFRYTAKIKIQVKQTKSRKTVLNIYPPNF